MQLLGTGWDVQKWEMWGWGSVFSSVAKQRAKLRAGYTGLAQLCFLRGQTALHISSALTHGEQAEASRRQQQFGWKDNICCSWLFLRQVLFKSGGQVQVFQWLDSAPGLCSPHCFKSLSVSAFSIAWQNMCRKASFHHCSSHLLSFTTKLVCVLDFSTVLNVSLPLHFRVFSWFFASLSYQAS